MKVTDMISEWYKGCSCCYGNPINCNECTIALIKSIDNKAFVDELKCSCDKIIHDNGVFGFAMVAGHTAMAVEQRSQLLRARNEQANTKD